MGGPERGSEDPLLYRRVREFGAGALVVLAVLLGLIDALSDTFTVDPIVLGIVLAGALIFAGRDPGRLRS